MTETTKNNLLTFFKNTIIYTCIGVFGFILYNYNNKTLKNIPHTDFSFVYAQF